MSLKERRKKNFGKMVLPQKIGVSKPFFDYEFDILKLLESHKYIWIKKATGLGITEFFLRYIVWRCLYNDDWKGRQVPVVVGPNLDLAVKLIKRIKKLFEIKHNIYFEDKQTALELNGCTIESFPSNHLSSFRSLESPAFIYISEGDFFGRSEQHEVRHVSERYIAKSDPYIAIESTPNEPGGLFEQIEREDEETCIYKRLVLDYKVGLGKIYSQEEIEKLKRSPSFEREYCCRYLGHQGNTFRPEDIERCKSIKYDPDKINRFAAISLGIDPGWGSSAFAISILQLNNEMIEVLYASEFEKADYNEMLNKAYELYLKFSPTKIYIDGLHLRLLDR
jgi:hypothetical protein